METCYACKEKYEKWHIKDGMCKDCDPFTPAQQKEACLLEMASYKKGKYRVIKCPDNGKWVVQLADKFEKSGWLCLHDGT